MLAVGIYSIINLVTGQAYIGSSTDILYRLATHLSELRTRRHPNPHLQRAWNLYGQECFTVVILQIVEDKDTLLQVEQWYLDSWPALYNICKVAGKPPSTKGLKKSAAERARMSAVQKALKPTALKSQAAVKNLVAARAACQTREAKMKRIESRYGKVALRGW